MSMPSTQILVPEVLIDRHRPYTKRSRRRMSRLKISVCMTARAAMAIKAKAAQMGVKPAQIVKLQHVPLFLKQMRLIGNDYAFQSVLWADRDPDKFKYANPKDKQTKLYVHKEDTFIFTGTKSQYDLWVDLIHEDDTESERGKYVTWWL